LVLVDTHCHLDFPLFDPDREAVIEKARKRGVGYIINPGTNLETSQMAVRLSESHPGIFAAVGIHPSEISTWDDQTEKRLWDLLEKTRVVAIGEIGLDYYHQPIDREAQKELFLNQLGIAAQRGLPVIVHSRNAIEDVFTILSKWHAELIREQKPLAQRPGVLHSFEGDSIIARDIADLNFYIGIGGPITYNNATKKERLVKEMPLERMMIETDAPFLPPQPFRGQRNEPAHVIYVAEKIASIKNEALAYVSDITTATASYLFRQGFSG
jgi:TatD DNase family protein